MTQRSPLSLTVDTGATKHDKSESKLNSTIKVEDGKTVHQSLDIATHAVTAPYISEPTPGVILENGQTFLRPPRLDMNIALTRPTASLSQDTMTHDKTHHEPDVKFTDKDSKGDGGGENKSNPGPVHQEHKHVKQPEVKAAAPSNDHKVTVENADHIKFGHTEYRDKLNKIKRIAKHLDPTVSTSGEYEYFRNISHFFGEGTDKFSSIDSLKNFLNRLKNDAATKNQVELRKAEWDEDTLRSVKLAQNAVEVYEKWKLSDEHFNEEVDLAKVEEGLALRYTLPRKQVSQDINSIAVTAGLQLTMAIVEEVAHEMIEKIEKDKERENERERFALILLRLVLNVVNAGVAVEFLQVAMTASNEATVSTNQLIAAATAAETAKDIVDYGTHELLLLETASKKLSSNSISTLMKSLWSLSSRHIGEKLALTEELKTTLPRKELEKQIQEIRKDMLRPALLTCKHPETFDYTDFITRALAAKVKEKNEELFHKYSLTDAEKEAKVIMTQGGSHREHIKRFMIRYFAGGTLCRDYFEYDPKKPILGYEEVKDDKTQSHKIQPGFNLMQKRADGTYRYFPEGIEPKVLNLFDPTPPPITRRVRNKHGKMHIGGPKLRSYLFEHLHAFSDAKQNCEVYGYKKNGEFKNKDRIRDTWRAEQMIQIFLMKSTSQSKGLKTLLPFPTFKNPEEIGYAVLEILRANVFFRNGNYVTSSDCPAPTPVYLLTHMKDYVDLLDRPGVKEELRKHITFDFILQCLTDPNIQDTNDKKRMIQELDNMCEFLRKIGGTFNDDYLNKLHPMLVKYIDLQCGYNDHQVRLQEIENTLFGVCNEDFLVAKKGELQERLTNCEGEFNKLFEVCDKLRKERGDDDVTVRLIEEIVISYLEPLDSPELRGELNSFLPKLLEKHEIPAVVSSPIKEGELKSPEKKQEVQAMGLMPIKGEEIKDHGKKQEIQRVEYLHTNETESKLLAKISKDREVDRSVLFRAIRDYHFEIRLLNKYKKYRSTIKKHKDHVVKSSKKSAEPSKAPEKVATVAKVEAGTVLAQVDPKAHLNEAHKKSVRNLKALGQFAVKTAEAKASLSNEGETNSPDTSDPGLSKPVGILKTVFRATFV